MTLALQWQSISYLNDGRVVFVVIIPTDGHEESASCWCDPWMAQDCPECDGRGGACWRCGGRKLVDYDRWGGEVPWCIHNDERLS